MRKDKDFSFVATSKPINRTAGIVMQKGIGFISRTEQKAIDNETSYLSKIPIPRKDIPKNDNKFKDLTGQEVGGSKIWHYIGSRKQGGSKWLIKCNCGYFYVMNKNRINKWKRKNNDFICGYCRDIKELKEKSKSSCIK